MTDLSPAAQAIWVAYLDHSKIDETPADLPALAAAIEALADQMVPSLEEPNWGACDEMRCDIELYTDHMRKRSQILAIATELKGNSNV